MSKQLLPSVVAAVFDNGDGPRFLLAEGGQVKPTKAFAKKVRAGDVVARSADGKWRKAKKR